MGLRDWLICCGLLLTLAACSALAGDTPTPSPGAVVISPTPGASETPTPSPAPSPTRTPWPTVETTPRRTCEGAPASRLIVQERGRVTESEGDLNLRDGPGTDNRILARLQPGEPFFVIGGPTCADGYTWFQVRARDLEGWIAEGDLNQYYAEPYLTG